MLGAVTSIVLWGITGPLFGYSDTWQLVINTATTIIIFLMVFVIQNMQNCDTAAMHIKIDELISVTQKARNVLLDLEEVDKCNARAAEAGLRAAGLQGKVPYEHAGPRRGGASEARKDQVGEEAGR
jgi:low affinity Fe/Cu permease